jgi:myosin heavy subunit
MSVQIYSYGAFIRLVTDGSVLMLAKVQVKSIEVVRDDTVKISQGAGPLQEILIKLSDVTLPSGLVDVAALRDAISHMLDNANGYEENALNKLQTQIDHLNDIKQLFNLWHSTLQIDLNFQQLQVNGLVAINNRLLETKEGNEKILEGQQKQTDELKKQITELASLGNTLALIKGLTDTSIDNQQEQTAKLEGQLTILNAICTVLSASKGVQETLLTKQDSQITLLTSVKWLLTDIKEALSQNP